MDGTWGLSLFDCFSGSGQDLGIQPLQSRLLKGGSIQDYLGENYKGYKRSY